MTGSAAANYTLGSISTATANITKKSLTGSFTAANKEYNGNNAATVATRAVTGKVGSDDVNHTGGTATFNNALAGTGKTVSLTGATLTGSAAANYTLSSFSTTTANINTKALTGSFTAANKVYDGTTSASVSTRSVSGKVGSDNVNHIGGTATFANALAGTGKTVTLTGATLTGSAAANYTLDSISTTTANITKATPTIFSTPTASAINFGQALSNSILSGGQARLATNPVAGSFAWVNPSLTTLPKGTNSQPVRFTPTEVNNYNSVTSNVNVRVN